MSSAAKKPQTPDPVVDSSAETQRTAEAAVAAANEEEAKDESDLDERALRIARETLTGDIRDIMLNDMKEKKSNLPWNMRSEAAQTAIIDQVTRMAESIVTRVVGIVAAGGRRTIHATLAQLTVKEGIKGVIEVSQFDEQRHLLMDAVGSRVQIVVAEPESFTGERKPVPIIQDQKSLITDEGAEGSETL